MSTGKTNKKERNDIYTAFGVLGLFLLFGFYMTGSSLFSSEDELVADWVEQPVAPVGYEGYPQPHDDESLREMPVFEEIEPLPKRKIKTVASSVAGATTMAAVAAPSVKPTPATKEAMAKPTPQPIQRVELKTAPATIITPPKLNVEEKAVELKKPVAKPIPKVAKKIAPKPAPKAKPVAPAAPLMTTKAKDADPANTNYITSELPCVWIVGIFKNSGNINRVVARLRLNKFDVGTGAHEKGTYVGVPCACEGEDAKAEKLRELFSAQPWLLRK